MPADFPLRLRRGFLCLVVSTCAALLSASPSRAAEPAAGAELSPWTIDDLLLSEQVAGVEVSPDGRQAVWAKSALDKEKGGAASNLYLTDLASGRELQLTRGTDRHAAPHFSPDGTRISFLSNRASREAGGDDKKAKKGAKTQLWLLSLAGGEPWQAVQLAREPRAYAWADDDHIVFAAQEEPTLDERQREEGEDDAQAVEDEKREPPVRLFRLTLSSRKVERLTTNRDWIDLLEVSPDGRWAVTRQQQNLRYEYDQSVPPKTVLTDLATGAQREIRAGSRLVTEAITWEPSSAGFYFIGLRSSHPRFTTAAISELHHFDLASGREEKIDLGWDRGLDETDILALPDGFLASLADGVYSKPARYVRRGGTWERSWVEGTHARHLWHWAASRDGATLAYEHSTTSQPPQWFGARLEGARITGEKAFTRLNPGFAKRRLPCTEVVRFQGARGDEVEALLHYPLDYRDGERRPLILMTHGGPAAHDIDAWHQGTSRPLVLFNQKGAFCLEVNYHGSTGYGLEWVESIAGHYYELEIPDLEAGVDAMIARGLADPERLATSGWSNGGILSAELITRTRRYKAASIGAADVEWISDWGNVDFGVSFDDYYFGASPLEKPQVYIDKSPFFRLPQVTTPTLIFHGSDDRNVPPSQSWSLFRALQQSGKTDVRFVVFPGEPHGLRTYAHRKRKIEEDLAWFDRYLFGKASTANPALKPGSPLAMALLRAKAQQVDGLAGRRDHGALVPEAVAVPGLAAGALGRFEVTRAQLAAFDPAYRFPAGTANHPATGVTFERAKAYAAWLSKKTGETWRLPAEAEVRSLYERQAGQGNTLDTWAGFAPTPEEEEALRAEAAKLGGEAPLAAEVGRFDHLGDDDPVFDLGGNVAEWTTAADGSGKLLGSSADRPAEPKSSGPGSSSEAAPAYRGLRVMKATAPTPAARPAG